MSPGPLREYPGAQRCLRKWYETDPSLGTLRPPRSSRGSGCAGAAGPDVALSCRVSVLDPVRHPIPARSARCRPVWRSGKRRHARDDPDRVAAPAADREVHEPGYRPGSRCRHPPSAVAGETERRGREQPFSGLVPVESVHLGAGGHADKAGPTETTELAGKRRPRATSTPVAPRRIDGFRADPLESGRSSSGLENFAAPVAQRPPAPPARPSASSAGPCAASPRTSRAGSRRGISRFGKRCAADSQSPCSTGSPTEGRGPRSLCG